ncbi:hypothetical protein SNEBB_008650 [Seison nebaliae]|nr:hypothetical protein SNEBB_008650 [Seison nebaliae]
MLSMKRKIDNKRIQMNTYEKKENFSNANGYKYFMEIKRNYNDLNENETFLIIRVNYQTYSFFRLIFRRVFWRSFFISLFVFPIFYTLNIGIVQNVVINSILFASFLFISLFTTISFEEIMLVKNIGIEKMARNIFGIELNRRFIQRSLIQSFLILEKMHNNVIVYYTAFLLKRKQMESIFENVLPRRNVLIEISNEIRHFLQLSLQTQSDNEVSLVIMTRGNQRELARAKNQKKQGGKKQADSVANTGLTLEQRKARDAERMQEKQRMKDAKKTEEKK